MRQPISAMAEFFEGREVTIMLAAYYSEQGAARDVLHVGEQPTPAPGPGEVRVRLRTSGVNPSDWKVRLGGFGRGMVAPLVIPHSDGAGDIDAVGPGVADRTGERVWIWNGQWKRAHGTAAEYIVVPSTQAVRLPQNVSYAEGACLGIPALTAVHAVRLAGLGPGATVLVAGGAGAVAHYAIQLAKLRRAVVLATVSSDAKAAHARGAGADAVINYRDEDVAGRVKALTDGRGVDAVIELDLTRNAKLYPLILRPHASVIVYGTSAGEATLPALWMMQNSITVRLFLIYDVGEADRAAGIAELSQWLEAGKLQHTIAQRLPLDRIAEAHEIVERGEALGNVVLDIE
jgi:NADPH2:quinone reductase